ncbi:MAG: DUF3149 domain-containing protein [Burkholderiaceae bacterium]
MGLWGELFSDWVGILSFIVLAFIGVMATFFIWYFNRNMMRDPGPANRDDGDADRP